MSHCFFCFPTQIAKFTFVEIIDQSMNVEMVKITLGAKGFKNNVNNDEFQNCLRED